MFIKIDTREQELFTKCQQIIEFVPKFKDIKIISQTLPLGDIIINDGINDCVIIERKTLTDLAARGLLDSTLVIWGGEFGRTSDSQGAKGRDHNPNGFTIWLAGAGVKGGFHFGATDDFGYKAVQNKVHVNDLHATLLHLMGLDHTKLTYRFNGRDYRLTDVAGEVVKDILI
jgi:hypothetical protein